MSTFPVLNFDRIEMALLAMVGFIVVVILVDYARVLLLRRQLPPGPFPLPIVGNVLQLPKSKPWIMFEKWSQDYNDPLITVWVGRAPSIIVNDAWTASELMEKRANIYSSRPRHVVLGDMLNNTDTNQTLLTYGDRWRIHRKLTHMSVGSQAVRSHIPFQRNEAKILTLDLLNDAKDYVMAIERYSCSVVSIIGWGRRIDRKNDYVVQQACALMDQSVNIQIPGAYWAETIPELRSLPSWIYPLPKMMWDGGVMMKKYFYALTAEGAAAKAPNFSKYLLQAQKEHDLTNEDIAGLTANLIGGGVDTTSSTMISCILGCIAFPEAQRRAQEEIDSVVGQDRSPTLDDEAKLPCSAALLKETFRWRTVAILGGLPHAPTRDDEYRGYHFPAGINITGNLWAIHRHPRDFPDPDVFRPGRYLDGQRKPYPNERGHNAFGWGRRQCSGQPLAEQGLMMSLTRILWAFNIEAGVDDQERVVKPDIFAYTDGENTRPQPFPAKFSPRSERIRQILLEEAKVAREELKIYDGETRLRVTDFDAS